MALDFYFTFLVSLVILFLGIVVYLHDRKSTSNVLFSLFSLVNVLFLVVNYISVTAKNEMALFWIRLVLFFAIPQALTFFLFVNNFPSPNLKIRKSPFLILNGLGLMLMMITLFTPLVFASVRLEDGKVVPMPGKLIPVFAIYAVGLVLATLVSGVKSYLKAMGLERKQWLFMGLGTALTLILLILFNFIATVLFSETAFIQLTPIFLLPMIILIAYAILRHELLNIKVFATEVVTFVLWVIVLTRILLADSLKERVINGGFLVFLIIFGTILIRSVLTEINQRKKLEELTEELRRANEKLKELDQLKTEFVNVASHELRTPMTAINNYLWMVLHGKAGKVTLKQNRYLERAAISSQRLIDLVNDMLTISRIERGKIEVKPRAEEMLKLTKSVVEELKLKAVEKKIKLLLKVPAKKLPLVMIDEDRIKQVLFNIIGNAIKFTPNKGKIVVSFKRKKRVVIVLVADTGTGIVKEDIPKLFKKFGRLDRSYATVAEAGGTGLGLYICKQIIDLHRGKIGVKSEVGKGSTFYFSLRVTERS